MPDHTLQIFETLGAATRVIELSGPGPMGTGPGADNYLCGACGNVLIAGTRPGQIPSTITCEGVSAVIRCGKCQSTNGIP